MTRSELDIAALGALTMAREIVGGRWPNYAIDVSHSLGSVKIVIPAMTPFDMDDAKHLNDVCEKHPGVRWHITDRGDFIHGSGTYIIIESKAPADWEGR